MPCGHTTSFETILRDPIPHWEHLRGESLPDLQIIRERQCSEQYRWQFSQICFLKKGQCSLLSLGALTHCDFLAAMPDAGQWIRRRRGCSSQRPAPTRALRYQRGRIRLQCEGQFSSSMNKLRFRLHLEQEYASRSQRDLLWTPNVAPSTNRGLWHWHLPTGPAFALDTNTFLLSKDLLTLQREAEHRYLLSSFATMSTKCLLLSLILD